MNMKINVCDFSSISFKETVRHMLLSLRLPLVKLSLLVTTTLIVHRVFSMNSHKNIEVSILFSV